MNRDISELLGKVLTKITNNNDEMRFHTDGGESYLMYHEQACCEYVGIEEIIGDLDDLIGVPILMAEEVSEDATDEQDVESGTWTFYKFATINGYVTIRWFGTSNGYYSESVDFVKEENA